MELIGKIKAKIFPHTFDGVPEDTVVTIFVPGVKKPIKATLSDIEIQAAAQTAIEELKPPQWYGWTFSTGTLTLPAGTFVAGDTGVDTAEPRVHGDEVLAGLREAIPGLSKITTLCPVCQTSAFDFAGFKREESSLADIIVHLNDGHQWSREQIADWLETKDWDLQFVTPEGATA